MSLYFATKRLLSLVPFSDFFFQYIYIVQVVVLLVAVWIQASATCVNIVFDAVSPVLSYYINKIPAADFGSQYGTVALNGLQFTRVITAKTALSLQNILGDTMSVLLCAGFFFTPSYIAVFGVVAVGMILPAFKTSKSVNFKSAAASESDHQLQWMQYWCCFGFIIALESFGFILWSNISMVLFCWLQHSYLKGANTMFAYVSKEAAALKDRHKKIALEKEKIGVDEAIPIIEENATDPRAVSKLDVLPQKTISNTSDTSAIPATPVTLCGEDRKDEPSSSLRKRSKRNKSISK